MGMNVTPHQFAEEVGTTRENIYTAIKNGRLTEGISKQGIRYKIDLEVAKAQWFGRAMPKPEELEEYQEGPEQDHSIPTLDKSQANEKYWKAKTAELNYRERAGELIEAAAVQRTYDDEVVACRTKLLAIGSRIRQRIDMTEEGYGLVEELIEESLEELGRG
jgi:hypothetical protein